MGKRSSFQDIAENNGIEILGFRLPSVNSMSTEINGKCYIGLDTSRPMSHAEEQACIGHELGHCLYGGFYTRSSPYDLVERHEARADRWYIRHAIPRKTLFRLLREGREVWEIAEMLDTTEEYVWQAYCYYRENR